MIASDIRCRKSRGFTLVEILVALVLMAFVSLLIMQALRVGQRAYAAGVKGDNDASELISAQQLLRRLIESADPGAAVYGGMAWGHLTGSQSELAFAAPAPGTFSGVFWYRLFLAYDAGTDRQDLILQWCLAPQLCSNSSHSNEILVRDVLKIDIAYASRETPSQWQSQWQASAMPSKIRLRLEYGEADRRHWPELVISPLLTHDGSCVFDVIAQDCLAS